MRKAWAEFYALPSGADIRDMSGSRKCSEPSADSNGTPENDASSSWQETLDAFPFLRDIPIVEGPCLEEIYAELDRWFPNSCDPFTGLVGGSTAVPELQEGDDVPDGSCAKSPAHSSRGNGVVVDA